MDPVALRTLCHFEKGSTGLAKAEPGGYVLVATSAERRTCNTYQFDTKAVCIPLVSSTGHGHASLNNVHYQEGKFALGSILVALTSKDESKLNVQFLHLYLSRLKDQVLVPLMSGAANVALSVKKIQNIEIPLPSIDRQREIVEQFKSIVNEEGELKSELVYQQALLKNLRQQILQEAIEGKLTVDWRKQNLDIEPAKELLVRLKSEKALLLKDKKVRKLKLFPVRSNRKPPFELPEMWEWCQLSDISVINPRNKIDDELDVGFTPMPLVSSGLCHDPKYEVRKWKSVKSGFTHFSDEDVVVAKITPCFENSKAGVISGYPNGMGAGTTELHVIRKLRDEVESRYLYFFVKTTKVIENGKKVMKGAVGQKRVPKQYIEQLHIPMPPVAEQKAIVTKVESLLSLCDQLEFQVNCNQTNAGQLMRATLKEAFNYSAPEATELGSVLPDNISPFKPKGADYYKRTILAAEIVNQLHNESTLGHLKLQKLIYLCQRTQDMNLPTNFLQQAAGPYDPKMARSLDKQFRDKKWFEYRKDEFPKYSPLENAGQHKADYQKYFKDQLDGVEYIVELFRTAKSDQMEVVATLYACCEKIIEDKEPYSEALVIQHFYEWSEQKKKYTQPYVEKTLSWMKDKHVYPAIETS